MESSSRLLVFLGLSFTGLTAAAVYLLLRKDEETGVEGGLRTSQRTVIKVQVPNECIGTVIGRGGCNVKAIQEKTGARINCSDEQGNDKFRVVIIQGTRDAAQLAESMIHEIVTNQPLIISHEMLVPSRACGRIIGRGGETIRGMTRVSGAKILVDSTGQNERSETRIVLKGTSEQINYAKSLIEEKVAEEEDMRRRFETSFSNRSPRREPKDNYNYLVAPPDEQDSQPTAFKRATFDSSRSDGFFDVFVSAAVDPHQFWVQSVSPRGVELDQLVDKMTEYYGNPENLEMHTLKEIRVGQIVAAPFEHDDKWYRAEIVSIEEDEYDPTESKVTLYYGDYGDECVVKRKQLFDLRTDFLGLYFQAIECALAHVKPIGDKWSTEAADLFEELADVALWQKKVAHVVTYRESVHKRGQRAGSPVPVIELHDKNINIGEELVKKGFAVWESPSPNETSDESNTSKPNLIASSQNASSSQRPQSLNKTVNNVKQSPIVKSPDPLKMSPSEVFGPEASTSNAKSSSSDSSSFLKQERGKKAAGGFRPKTLEPLKDSKKTQKNSDPVQVVFLPEDYSDDESDDGFTLG
ncbi:tudor and KH domain-containing protein homolog [Thrips palmi]|uniref:Tudor and KH domain-containing protein homolog n=1 Tax=Thrips palmi TaxID=161013 RepID=A0A6P9AF51_THRPL|nr:tudor and KH domain-containing protein homolog [Thrips palmi]